MFFYSYEEIRMMEKVMLHIKNFFPAGNGCHSGAFTISQSRLDRPAIHPEAIFRIKGSMFNDGVHQVTDDLKDESFIGTVTLLAIPDAFIDLVKRIAKWERENADKNYGIYQSESFGGYSYTLNKNSAGNAFTWKDVFRHELNLWRKI